MSPLTAPPLQTVVFADLDAGIWGVAWGSPDGVARARAAAGGIRRGGDGVCFQRRRRRRSTGHLAGDSGELTISPVTDAGELRRGSAVSTSCARSGGSWRLPRTKHSARSGSGLSAAAIDPPKVQSLRDACVWFAPDDGLVLTALRPSGSRGHDHDLVAGIGVRARSRDFGRRPTALHHILGRRRPRPRRPRVLDRGRW